MGQVIGQVENREIHFQERISLSEPRAFLMGCAGGTAPGERGMPRRADRDASVPGGDGWPRAELETAAPQPGTVVPQPTSHHLLR